MTALNLSSVAVDSERVGRNPDTRLWTGLVIGLGFIAICLNAWLFLLVQEQDHSIAARETEVQRRLVAVEAQEARRTALQKEIRDLKSRKTVAERQAEDAERAAADATQLVANRDRALNELRDAQVEGSRLRADANSLKNQIAPLKAEEASLRKAISARLEDIKALDQQRSERETAYLALKSQYNDLIGKTETARKEANDATMLKADGDAALRDLQARRQELAKLQVELESARSAKSVLLIDQAATQKALAARSEAEGALSKAQGELQVLQDQIAKARAGLAQTEERRKNANYDEAATNRATTARLEADKALMKAQSELSSVSSQLSAAQDQLLLVQRQRASISLDTAAMQQAERAREEAEALLAKTREELDVLRRQVAEETGRRDAMLVEIERLQKRSGQWNPASAEPKPPAAAPRKPPSPPRN